MRREASCMVHADSGPLLIIPAWNEARNLGPVLVGVAKHAPEFEVVVVDDGSTDATSRVAREHEARVLRHPYNLGYGAALQTGYRYAASRGVELIVQMDGDGQHDPKEIAKLARPVQEGEFDLVLGSRFLDPGGYEFGVARRAGRDLFGAIAKRFGLELSDPTTGYQAMNADVLALYSDDFFPADYPDVDVLLVAHRHGIRIGERSVAMAPGLRPSTIHGGLKPLYYVYKMLLSIGSSATARTTRQP